MPLNTAETIVLDRVDSTNNYAMALIRKGMAVDGTSVFAHEQFEGKGRMGKQWKSKAGENILLSVVTRVDGTPLLRQFELSMAVALAGYDFLHRHLQKNISIKWPNDLFIGDRKAGGILIENILQGTYWQWAVIGIGLNINQLTFISQTPAATSLRIESGRSYEPLVLAAQLKDVLMGKIRAWKSGEGQSFSKVYNERLYARGEKVKLRNGNRTFETTIVGVTSEGELITRDSLVRQWSMGEIQWVIGK